MNPWPGAELELFALLVFVWCAVMCAVLVPLARRAALRLGVLDHPGDRKIHLLPMPRLGGLAVFITFLFTVLVGYLAVPALRTSGSLHAAFETTFSMFGTAWRISDKLLGILAGATVAFAVGFADDVLGVRFPVALKLGGQITAALILVGVGIQTSLMPAGWLNALVTVMWVVGITNAFNFLDNMDGLSAGVAMVASGVLAWNAWTRGEFFILLILLAFAGTLLGFLRHNFHPATVFLGDCGSHFIGFTMASLTLLERYVTDASSTWFPVLMPVLVLAIPLLDTATVVVTRLREGRPIYIGDKRHLSHRLVSLGFSIRKAVSSIYLATFCFGVGAVLLPDATPAESVLILTQAAGFAALLLGLMFHDRPAPALSSLRGLGSAG